MIENDLENMKMYAYHNSSILDNDHTKSIRTL